METTTCFLRKEKRNSTQRKILGDKEFFQLTTRPLSRFDSFGTERRRIFQMIMQ